MARLLPRILADLGLPDDRRTDGSALLRAHTGVGELAWSAVSAASASAAALSRSPQASLDAERIALGYRSERELRIDGLHPPAFAPLSGFFAVEDGWVRTHGNYPHHAAALRDALALPGSAAADDVGAALSAVSAAEASARISAAGGLCVPVLRERPHVDAALRSAPLVELSRLAPAPRPARTPRAPEAPLRGIRVLDLTRVIAGPVATRALALLGAEVLRIDPPQLPEIVPQHLDTGHGKRSTLLDLRDEGDRRTVDELLETADVVVLGYRPDGLASLGLSARALARRRPGVIVLELSAWGSGDRRGFDSLVQAECGIAMLESPDGVTPGVLPAQALDHSAGYLLAAAALALVGRRDEEGGSWHARTSLRRVAAELLGMPRTDEPPVQGPLDPTGHLQRFDVDGTEVVTVGPALAYAGAPVEYAAPRPWGRDAPRWPPREA